ncbi:hypothetical protein DPMN_171013 [Dreissena polymorpha]|uniref:Uncharacterized protein n=1 Tax=Dreissena polymorpha TaxID=45954 RepID=A0A9D4DYZ4_DREPO|nr:hypothetical protein DPMN_171013 [Dreissena polymorpha]
MFGPAGSPTLNRLKLFNAGCCMRGPHGGAVLQLGSDQCLVCGGFEFCGMHFEVASEKA